MAKVILNPMIKELRGTLGDVVYRTSSNGTTYLSKRPDMSNVKWSKAQKGARQRFKEASHAETIEVQVCIEVPRLTSHRYCKRFPSVARIAP